MIGEGRVSGSSQLMRSGKVKEGLLLMGGKVYGIISGSSIVSLQVII